MSEAPSPSTSLEELFSRHPSTLTDTEVEAMIESFRAARGRWAQEETAAKAAGRRPNARKVAPKIELKDLDL